MLNRSHRFSCLIKLFVFYKGLVAVLTVLVYEKFYRTLIKNIKSLLDSLLWIIREFVRFMLGLRERVRD